MIYIYIYKEIKHFSNRQTKIPTNIIMKHLKLLEEFVNESKESDALANAINKSMIKIDDSMSYKDFALAVGKILKDEYGQHNFGPFMEVLHKDLGI